MDSKQGGNNNKPIRVTDSLFIVLNGQVLNTNENTMGCVKNGSKKIDANKITSKIALKKGSCWVKKGGSKERVEGAMAVKRVSVPQWSKMLRQEGRIKRAGRGRDGG